jgi:hypothetical protein
MNGNLKVVYLMRKEVWLRQNAGRIVPHKLPTGSAISSFAGHFLHPGNF